MTPRQLQCLNYIKSHRETHHVSPTLQEIADAMKLSKVTVFEMVGRLERQGAISRGDRRARSIKVLEPEPANSALHRWARLALPILRSREPLLADSLEPLIAGE